MKHASVNTRISVTVGALCLVLALACTGTRAAVLKRHLPPVETGLAPGEEALEPQPPVDLDMLLPFQHMDPVDVCLFKCNDCFQDDLLLDCANKVCLEDVMMGNKIDNFWLSSCPGLKRLQKVHF